MFKDHTFHTHFLISQDGRADSMCTVQGGAQISDEDIIDHLSLALLLTTWYYTVLDLGTREVSNW